MKLNQAPSVAKLDLSLRWVLKVDINLLNQHCKSADWLADLLTYWGSQGAQDTRVLKQLRHSWHPSTWVTWRAIEHTVTRALKVLKVLEEHVRNKALKELGNLGTWDTWGTWALEGNSSTRKALGHLSTQAIGYSYTQGIRGTLFSRLTVLSMHQCC